LISTQKNYKINLEHIPHDILLNERIHAAAFQNNTLGNPLFSNLTSLKYFDQQSLAEFFSTHFTAKRLVVSAVGFDHDTLVEYVNTVFPALPPDVDHKFASAKYTGGESLTHDREAKYAHVAIGFEGASFSSKDQVALSVLQTLMSGAGEYGVGGVPPKGIFSRLSQNVLSKQGVSSVQAVHHNYSDGGIFAVIGKVSRDQTQDFVKSVTQEYHSLTSNIPEAEITRAKNALKTSVLIGLESRAALIEDVSRQASVLGKITTPEELGKLIDAVTAKDVEQAAKKLIKTPLLVAGVGDLTALPRYDQIAAGFK